MMWAMTTPAGDSFPLPDLVAGKTSGLVRGRAGYIVGDRKGDDDRSPDAQAAVGTATFHPTITQLKANSPVPTALIHKEQTVELATLAQANAYNIEHILEPDYQKMWPGEIIDADGHPGVWLVTGKYRVVLNVPGGTYPPFVITVRDSHTLESPLWITDEVENPPEEGATYTTISVPSGGTVGDSLVKATGGKFAWGPPPGQGGGAVASVNGRTGTVVLGAADVGAATAAQGTKANTAVQPATLTTALTTKADQVSGAPGTFCGVRTAAQWAALGAPAGTGPFWGVST